MFQVPRSNTFNSLSNSLAADVTSQKVELFLSARNLLDMDVFSKSDPYIKVHFRVGPGQQERLLGRTETVDNNLNPNFVKSFVLDYVFEITQELRFQVFDQDNGNNDDFIGQAKTTLGAIAGAKGQTLLLDLVNKDTKKKPGKLIIRLETCQQSNCLIAMKWKARKLLNTDSFFDFWDRSDPYLKFLKIRNDNSLIESGRTQIIMKNLNPNWKRVQLKKNKVISSSSTTGKFKIECWDWEEGGENKHQFIGEVYLELQKLKNISSFPVEFPLLNRKQKNPGYIVLEEYKEIYQPSFLDYLRGGLQLNLSIAIDFTASNGIPTNPSSLHYMNPMKPNQYQMAINAVSRILLNYDSDQRIPCYGFGAKPMRTALSHCFPLSFNNQSTQAYGIQHLMTMYNYALSQVQLSGPTFFGPILQQAIKLASMNAAQGSNTYQILLILTDGQIHDMDLVTKLLVQNCRLPLSIIIVGVGNADFGNMVRLDGDDGLYDSQGKKAIRDIVQFVPFREVGMNPDLLAKELLAELPSQVTSYMGMINKMPNPPIEANFSSTQSIPAMSIEQVLQNQLLQALNPIPR